MIDNTRKMRITFQAIITGFVIFYMLQVQLPNSLSISQYFPLILCGAGLLYIMIRVCFKNVRKWEMILYYALDIILVIWLIDALADLGDLAISEARDNIPYDKNTPEYDEAYDDSEGIGLTNGFAFVLFGIPTVIITIIFAIIGLVRTCATKGINVQVIESVPQATTMPVNTNSTTSSNAGQSMYCRYCGKLIEADAQFCRYCGKQVK